MSLPDRDEPPIPSPRTATHALASRIIPVQAAPTPWKQAPGRVLASPLTLDRPSPAHDLSAMDGYALPPDPLRNQPLRVIAEARPGSPPPPVALDRLTVIRIFTGAPVPPSVHAVIPRELVTETTDAIVIPELASITQGMHIRRKGENAPPGTILAPSGSLITPGILAAIAACGIAHPIVRRPLRIAVLGTGDEVLGVDQSPLEWQIRDSNGPSLYAALAALPWIDHINAQRVPDDPARIRRALHNMLDTADAILITGGVSAGDYDFVPGILRDLSLEIIFHKLPLRPGKPALAAVTADGRPVLGLPGNPVSVLVTSRLIAMPALCARAGLTAPPAVPRVRVHGKQTSPPHLWWYPLARIDENGDAVIVSHRGSGDWVAAASADGFVEIPPATAADGMRSWFPWTYPAI
ncbi:MAG: molybdopterin molybdotransferase MoeA [Phycisphaeraceae bacterium]|nr:molybdopterin molybdotransferase MoeA [Phycisphaeraceae bacterium]